MKRMVEPIDYYYDAEPDEDEIAVEMQSRCVFCLREQYGPAVYAISHGEHPCVWCGVTPAPMTTAEYQRALSRAYNERDKAWRNSK